MILTLNDLDFNNKRVLIRVDYNVPLDSENRITDSKRIEETLPTINKILMEKGKVILMSHLGRPKGEVNLNYSLKPVSKRLSELLNKEVKFVNDCVGDEVKAVVSSMNCGEILLLENLRFHKEEEKNDPEFAKQLASLADIFINDAFGTAHRAHASTEGVTHFVAEKGVGYLIQKELKFLGEAVQNPKRPLLAILGGSKVSGKIDVIKALMDKCDSILVGGGMIFTFYKAMGIEVGASLVEADKIELAGELLNLAKQKNVELILPQDVVVADKFANDANIKTVNVKFIPEGFMGLDIGFETIDIFSHKIVNAKTIIWNGPMGVFEMSNFELGTKMIARALALATDNGAVTIVGGGDSASAIATFGLEKNVSHVSTGGGASLEFLEGKNLPGVVSLEMA